MDSSRPARPRSRRLTRHPAVIAAAVLVSTVLVSVAAQAVPSDPGPGPALTFRPISAIDLDPAGPSVEATASATAQSNRGAPEPGGPGGPGRSRPARPADESLPPAPAEPAAVAPEAPMELPSQVPPSTATAATAAPPAPPAPPAAPTGPRFRMAALAIDQGVLQFPCDRATPPDDHVYRWGCAGRNNLYLLGHAASVFRALHDAYVAGRLQVGMAAEWVENGRAATYRVTTWRLVLPTDTAWAIASQSVPSMTLQTCYGANNEYRLLVRLVT